jgi:DNA-binding response OmpR family regulator
MSRGTPPAGLSVLVVEDQPDVADSLRMFLELAGGHSVRVARDGHQGVEMAVRDRPDAVICDIGLPKKNGFQVATEIRGSLPRKPLLIAVTGYGQDWGEADALRAGFDVYRTKPADPVELNKLLLTWRPA